RTFLWSPITKSTTGTCRGSPCRGQSVQTPSREAVSEIIGPAGSDMQMLPPTVASFQILKEARNARQQWRNSGAAGQSGGAWSVKRSNSATLQVEAISRPSADAVRECQPRDSRSISVWTLTCGSENSQVPPASQANPGSQEAISSARVGRRTRVTVCKSMTG